MHAFENYADSPIAPALACFVIVPSDSEPLSELSKALYVGEGGDVCVLPVRGDDPVIFRNVPAGFILDVRVRAVRATGTTAGSIVGLA